jgi:hypothetical protein
VTCIKILVVCVVRHGVDLPYSIWVGLVAVAPRHSFTVLQRCVGVVCVHLLLGPQDQLSGAVDNLVHVQTDLACSKHSTSCESKQSGRRQIFCKTVASNASGGESLPGKLETRACMSKSVTIGATSALTIKAPRTCPQLAYVQLQPQLHSFTEVPSTAAGQVAQVQSPPCTVVTWAQAITRARIPACQVRRCLHRQVRC